MSPSSAFITAASNVPPPKSNTSQNDRLSESDWNPYARDAATGSCRRGLCTNPASSAARLVAMHWRWANAAGIVMTAALMSSSIRCWTLPLRLFRTSAESSSGDLLSPDDLKV